MVEEENNRNVVVVVEEEKNQRNVAVEENNRNVVVVVEKENNRNVAVVVWLRYSWSCVEINVEWGVDVKITAFIYSFILLLRQLFDGCFLTLISSQTLGRIFM